MAEPKFDNSWLKEASQVLPDLLKKSLDLTIALNEAANSVHRANEACKMFFLDCITPPACTRSSTNTVDENDKVLFVSVATSLANDGSFWCRYWTSNISFENRKLNEISDELGWMEKEMSVEKANTSVLNTPLFFYSPAHGLYLRVMILKHSPPEQIVVRCLDLGSLCEVSQDAQFYFFPRHYEKKHPYLSMYCTLTVDESPQLPYEAKWLFRDLTYNQILMAKIKGETVRNDMKCFIVEMKSLLGEEFNINKQIIEKVKQHDLENEVKSQLQPQPQNSTSIEEAVFKKPSPVITSTEPVKQGTIKYEKRYSNSRSTSKENIAAVEQRAAKHDKRFSNSRSSSRENLDAAGRKSKKSRSRNNSHTNCSVSSEESKALKVESRPISPEEAELPRVESRSVSHEEPKPLKVKSRSSSLTNINKTFKKNDMSRSTESLVCLQPASTLSVDEQGEERLQLASPKGKTDHPTVIQTKKCEMDKIKDNDVLSVELKKKKEIKTVDKLDAASDEKHDKIIHNENESNEIDIQINKSPIVINPDSYWVDQIPLESRAKIPQILPPLMNMYYTSDKLRFGTWVEFELMNVDKLLNSQAILQFYLYNVSRKRLLSSFKCHCLEIPDLDCFREAAAKKTSQYLVLRQYYPQYGPSRPIIGIAKIDVVKQNKNGRVPVSYLSLSRLGNGNPEWEKQINKSVIALPIKTARAIVQAYHASLRANKNYPEFPELFPWCGMIPPLMDTAKSDTQKSGTQKGQRKAFPNTQPPEQVTNYAGEYGMQKNTSCTAANVTPCETLTINNMAEELWDDEEEEQKAIPDMSVERKEAISLVSVMTGNIEENNICNGKETTSFGIEEKQPSRPTILQRPKAGIKGYYDSFGMWYPDVPQASTSVTRLRIFNTNVDVNENLISESTEDDMLHNEITNESLVVAKEESFEEESSIVKNIEQLISSPSEEVLPLRIENSQDSLEEQHRFEQDCSIFGVSTEDFEHLH